MKKIISVVCFMVLFVAFGVQSFHAQDIGSDGSVWYTGKGVGQDISDIPPYPNSVRVQYSKPKYYNLKGVKASGVGVVYTLSYEDIAPDEAAEAGAEAVGEICDYVCYVAAFFEEEMDSFGWQEDIEKRSSGSDDIGGNYVFLTFYKGNYLSNISISEKDFKYSDSVSISISKYDVSETVEVVLERSQGIKERAKDYVKAMKVDKTVRSFAHKLAAQFPGSFNIDQICSIFDYLYKKWKYVDDPQSLDYVASASETIQNFKDNGYLSGDCDDFAVLMASLIEEIGGEARIALGFKPESGHAYAEVKIYEEPSVVLEYINSHYSGLLEKFLGMSRVEKLYYRSDDDGNWLNLDWSSQYPGGQYYNSISDWSYDWYLIYSDGRYKAVKQTGYYEGNVND